MHKLIVFDLDGTFAPIGKGKLEYETTYSFERIGDALEWMKKGL